MVVSTDTESPHGIARHAAVESGLRLPDFLIIGAARSGTTWLYECLLEHPQIFLPAEKRPEPHFFLKSDEYRRGLEYYSRRYFSNAADSIVAGEASTSYLYQPFVASRVRAALPDAKLIVLLRDPAERAFSNHAVTYRNGIDALPFSAAIRAEPERLRHPESQFHAEVAPFAYIDRGRYSSQLLVYLGQFRRDQLCLLWHDDVRSQPDSVLSEAFRFLGVDDAFRPSRLSTPKNSADYGNTRLSADDREFVIRQLRDEIEGLADLTGRNLDRWLQTAQP